MYYTIDEETARRAKEMNSFSDYVPGSVTEEYRRMVDKAAALAEKCKAGRCSSFSTASRMQRPATF